MKVNYPGHHQLVLVWPAGRLWHSEIKGAIAWTEFKVSDNKDYGNDVLIVLC